ncbi:MAG: penicillin-binding transpeptidase domain-containing protein [Lachnospira sp.]
MREIFDYIVSLLKSRIFPLIMVFVLLVVVMVNRLFNLQIINGESYVEDLTSSIQKTMSVKATRGRIFDKNGVLLAYNELAFAVKISDSGTYPDVETKADTLNNSIDKTLTIIENNNDTYINDFPIVYEDGLYLYSAEGNSLLRFLRDSFGKKSISELNDEEKRSSAEETFKYLCDKYMVSLDDFSIEHALMIVNLRRYMAANSYNRYMTFTIANDVSNETVAAILENCDELVGVTIEEQYIRRYTGGEYCSQIVGYTGTISSSELDELGDPYENNDVVGKSGIEKYMESVLSGTKGEKTVYVDTVGRITQILDETEPVAGNDVYLTIDYELQKKIYYHIEDEIVTILLDHLVDSDEKYTYNEYGYTDKIYLTAKEVYFAFIDNNIISLNGIANGESGSEKTVYNSYLKKRDSVRSWLENELKSGSTAYKNLTDEQKSYVWYVYEMLKNDNIFNTSNVNTNDSVYKSWADKSDTSISQLLTYGISQNWIDMSYLTSEQYSSLSDAYNVLVDYIMDALETDSSFIKKIYNYIIKDGTVSPKDICLILYEQGILSKTDENSRYDELKSGTLTPFEFINFVIRRKIITPAQLALEPCSGSAVLTDVNDGSIIALVSYPSYDNNKFSGSVDAKYYNSLLNDNSKPLLNYATQSFVAPGSTFKICAAIAGLETGVITPYTTFDCQKVFTKVFPNPKCLYTHGVEDLTDAIVDSCNVYFFNVGYELGCSKDGTYNSAYSLSILEKYSDMLGLSTKCGIEIEESSPQASTTDGVTSCIGQGTHKYSALNLARYTTTIATSGKNYNLTLVDKVTQTDGTVVLQNKSEVTEITEISKSSFSAVQAGMIEFGETDERMNYFGVKIAQKSGTAQESMYSPDHSLLISYAPYDNPEIALAVVIPNGYTSGYCNYLSADIYKDYYGISDETLNSDD